MGFYNFKSDIAAGDGTLLIPAIQSPNFDESAQTGWAIMQNGDAYFFNITAEGSVTSTTVIVSGATGGIFIYSGVPANGNLIGSWAGSSGVDQFNNPYPAGLQILAGGELVTGNLIVNTDGLFIYGTVTTPTTVTKTSGSGTIPIPSGVTTVKAECWGAGGGGGTALHFGAFGAGGGEYAAEPSLAVTGGGSVSYTVGTGGTGGVQGGSASTDGGNSTITGSSSTVTAHGGGKATGNVTAGSGGTGSTNTTHFNGGNGGTTISGDDGGGGGGSSAGTNAAGNTGGTGSGSGGAGGAAPVGGGAGGDGGSLIGPGVPTNGNPGNAPGGAGGGSYAGQNGGDGASGQIRITYTVSSNILLGSVTAAAGTDSFGNSYLKGFTTYANDSAGTFIQELAGILIFGNSTYPTVASGAGAIDIQTNGSLLIEVGSTGGAIQLNQNGTVELPANRPLLMDNSSLPSSSANGPVSYGGSGQLKYVGSDGGSYNTGAAHFIASTTLINSTSHIGISGCTGISVASGTTYIVRGAFRVTMGSTAATFWIGFDGPSDSAMVVEYTFISPYNSTTPVTVIQELTSINAGQHPGTITANAGCQILFEGYITFSASGSLSAIGAEFTSGDSFTVNSGHLSVMPVT